MQIMKVKASMLEVYPFQSGHCNQEWGGGGGGESEINHYLNLKNFQQNKQKKKTKLPLTYAGRQCHCSLKEFRHKIINSKQTNLLPLEPFV